MATLLMACLTLALAGCQSSTVGSGPLQLSARCSYGYEQYKLNVSVGAFASSIDGRQCHYTYCRDVSGMCRGNLQSLAVANCQRATGGTCFIMDIDQKIVWDGEVTFADRDDLDEGTAFARDRLPETRPPEPMRRDDRRLLADPPADVAAAFSVDDDGRIVDGPRAAPGEPVDITTLLTNEVILDQFNNLAFRGGEIRLANGTQDMQEERRLKKYLGEILVRNSPIGMKSQRSAEADIRRAVADIAAKAGLPIRVAKAGEDNIDLIVFTFDSIVEAKALEEALTSPTLLETMTETERKASLLVAEMLQDSRQHGLLSCNVRPTIREDELAIAVVMINLDVAPTMTTSCYYEELIQALGLYRDDDAYVSSMFTDSFKSYQVPTALDWLMLRILYDPRLTHGMTRFAAQPILREILSELRPYGWEGTG